MELVLNTYGSALMKENDAFVVVSKEGKQIIPPDKLRSIQIGRGTKLTSDAAMLALKYNIDVFFMEKSGEPAGRLWSGKFGSVTSLRRKQLEFPFTREAVPWVKKVVIRKMDNQIALLLSLKGNDESLNAVIQKAIRQIEDYQRKVKLVEGEYVQELSSSIRGWEGAASKVYFKAISRSLPHRMQFQSRSQNPAMDVFNCLLNYGYGILYGKVESALIRAGLDPYAGVFHREDHNRPVLVFDVIEVFRIWIDYVVVRLCSAEVITDDCYSIRSDGSYWLEGLGKRILIQSVNDYLDEVVSMNGVERSRREQILVEARHLAGMITKVV
jgi:CRISPR-associated protein Cas1